MSADVKGGGFSGSSLGGIGGYGGNRGASGMGGHLQSAGLGKIDTPIVWRYCLIDVILSFIMSTRKILISIFTYRKGISRNNSS